MMEQERLKKAWQSAQVLLKDLRDVYARTDDVALEILLDKQIEKVCEISQILNRLKRNAQN